MKISEMVSLLEIVKRKHGDLYIYDFTEEKSISEIIVVLSKLYNLQNDKIEHFKTVVLK